MIRTTNIGTLALVIVITAPQQLRMELGDQGASGTGRLSASTGAGTWRGIGSSGTCSGRWEAEKR